MKIYKRFNNLITLKNYFYFMQQLQIGHSRQVAKTAAYLELLSFVQLASAFDINFSK